MCRYYVAVIATLTDASYTIMMNVQESMRTLQASVPLGAQEVACDGYVYYRVFVDHVDQGLTVAATPTKQHHGVERQSAARALAGLGGARAYEAEGWTS